MIGWLALGAATATLGLAVGTGLQRRRENGGAPAANVEIDPAVTEPPEPAPQADDPAPQWVLTTIPGWDSPADAVPNVPMRKHLRSDGATMRTYKTPDGYTSSCVSMPGQDIRMFRDAKGRFICRPFPRIR